VNLNWQMIVLNIRTAGLPVAAIARKIGMEPETLRRCATGEAKKEPEFSKGLALLELHLSVCPDKHHLERLKR
jgi:transposase-like protein